MTTVSSSYLSAFPEKKNQGPRGWPGPPGSVIGVYPGAGIALSTGSAWGSSITNNSTNWNTAYGWGNHASAGYASLASPALTGTVTITGNADILNLVGTDHCYFQWYPDGGGGGRKAYTGFPSASDDYFTIANEIAGKGVRILPRLGIGVDPSSDFNLDVLTSLNHAALFRARPADDLASIEFGSKAGVAWSHIQGLPDGSIAFQNGTVEKMRLTSGNLQEPNFISGWFGNNWQIAEEGDVEFMNMIIRGSARFRELIIDQLAILSGSQLLSVARGKILSVDTVNSKVTLDDPNNKGACAFLANDFFWIKTVDIDHGLFSDCRGQITNVTGVVLTLNFGVAGANGAITDVAKGDVVVQRGNSTTASRQNLMYTTVSDADAPFRRTMTGVDSLAAFNDLDNVVSQEGNLASLDSHDIIPASPGYGYYSTNAYLKGKIVLPSAGMTNEGSSGTDIRIWAGDSYANRTTAPFRVDQEGSLTATGVAELGTNSVSVLGASSNVAIQGPDIWENAYNGSNGLHINRLGYNGGATQYKQLTVWDGKATDKLFVVAGDTTNFIELGNENNSRELDVSIVGSIQNAWGVQFIYAYGGVSNNVLISWDSVATTVSTAYVKLKTLTLGAYLKPNRTLRLYFELKASSNTSYAQLYRNGVPVGTERSTSSVVYVPYYEDISGWTAGDAIELYVKSTAGNTASVQNFRICGDMITSIATEIQATAS